MTAMEFGVVVFPGSNCERDTYYALEKEGLSVKYLWHKEEGLQSVDCVILPGGFSYGDYLRSGAIARFSPIMKSVIKFAENGGLVLGICNGFQILLEAGLLPGAMLINRDLKFLGKDVYISVERTDTPFTNCYEEGEVLRVPIAHFEGNYYADDATLDELESEGRVVFRYCSRTGENGKEYNPNGANRNIAGICNKRRNIVGLMPHPERASDFVLGKVDGIGFWKSAASYLEGIRR